MEYMVIEHFDTGEFIRCCNRSIKAGWIPQGGVSLVHISPSRKTYLQAFIREEKNNVD